MRKVIYGMGVSLDGFIAAPGNNIDWSVPDEDLHRFHNEQARETGVELYGRGLHEVMRYWETDAATSPSASEPEREFARIWRATPKLVFSRTLESLEGEGTLVREDVADTIARLKEEPGGDIAVGGAGLAASVIAQGLIDEYRLFVYPIVLGGGTPYFPALDARIELRLAETRTFGQGVVYLRYERA